LNPNGIEYPRRIESPGRDLYSALLLDQLFFNFSRLGRLKKMGTNKLSSLEWFGPHAGKIGAWGIAGPWFPQP